MNPIMRWWRGAARHETRSISTGGYTMAVLQARDAYIRGANGLAELTATVQSCVSMWEAGLSLADVDGTDLLSRRTLALMARSLALRGEAAFLVRDDRLIAAAEWDLSTVDGEPRAYRLTLPDVGGGVSRTVLAGEVLHVCIGSDPHMPWSGSSPLRRASLTASMLHALEDALSEVYAVAPLGSQVLPFPESSETDLEELGRSFRGRRGRVMLRESVSVTAAGGPAPQVDWRPTSTSPDIRPAMPDTMLAAARNSVMASFGVLPCLLDAAAQQGPSIREAQRHLAQWCLQPIAQLIAEEASDKLGSPIALDVMRPLQAFDAGGRARAASTLVEALAKAKEAGVDPGTALKLVDWK